MCFRTLYVLVWSVGDDLVRVHDCTTSFFHPTWFGKISFCCNSRARQIAANVRSAKTECVRLRGHKDDMGEMCDSRTDRIYDPDYFPNLTGRCYRCQYAREIIIMVPPPHDIVRINLFNQSHRNTFLTWQAQYTLYIYCFTTSHTRLCAARSCCASARSVVAA